MKLHTSNKQQLLDDNPAEDDRSAMRQAARPEPARQAGRQAPAPKAAEKAVPGPSCDDHGQAGQLRRRQGRGDALGRAPEAKGFEYPSREFAPADPTTGAADEAVQVAGPG